MRRESFLVTDDGSTPDKPLERCFYCQARVGSEHESGCVMRKRTVVLRATVEFVRVIPEGWSPEEVDAYFNDGTWCAGNLVGEIRDHCPDEDDPDGVGCLCGCARVEFVREATVDDEAGSALKVAELRD